MAKAQQLNQFKRRFYSHYLTDSSEFFVWILIKNILQNKKKRLQHYWHQSMHIYAHETGVEIKSKSRLEFIYFPFYYLMSVRRITSPLDCEMHEIHLRLKKSAIQFYLFFFSYLLFNYFHNSIYF